MKRVMRNSLGQTKEVKIGYSWTTLFFGIWVPIFRGHWSMALKLFLLSIITCGIYGLVATFTINEQYVQYLLGQGYSFVD